MVRKKLGGTAMLADPEIRSRTRTLRGVWNARG
jgi:hypothetical protein